VFGCIGYLSPNILVQAPAQSNVQHLDTSANGQQRFALMSRPAGQCQLYVIALGRDFPTLFVERFTIMKGVDVLAARKQQAVEALIEVPQHARVGHKGDHHRKPASSGHSVGVGLVYSAAYGAVRLIWQKPGTGDADDRRSMTNH
jgi:hypothetical protein